ncbi:MAG: GNAT family N-acetyltransferase [bacterium]
MRPAVPADAARIGYVNAVTWQAAYAGLVPPGLLARQTPEALGAPQRGEFHLVAEDGQEGLVGFATAGATRHPEFAADAELWAIYVLPGHQDRGIGTGLFAAACDRLVAIPRASAPPRRSSPSGSSSRQDPSGNTSISGRQA